MLGRTENLLKHKPDATVRTGDGYLFDSGTTVPTDATVGYAKGCLFIKTDGGAGTTWYLNEGTNSSSNFDAIAPMTAAQEALLSATPGTVSASKAVIVDANKDITGYRQITLSTRGPIGLKLSGTYTTSAIVLGTTGTPLVLTAHDDHIIDIFSTCASTDGGNSVRPFYMKSTMTGAAGVGGRAEFHLFTNVALGGWSNAIKGFAEYGASGRTAGLGSAIVGELQLSAGTSSGTYAALEAELVAPSGASTGTGTSFIYMNTNGADVATLDTSAFFFEIGAGITAGSGKLFDSTVNTAGAQIDHTLKGKIDGGTYYLPLMDNADGS